MKKILYLKSCPEKHYEKYFNDLNEIANKDNMDLKVIYLFTENDKNPKFNENKGGKLVSFYYTLSILEREIQIYQPNVIALHVGLSFDSYPYEILQSLAVIKIKYPKIKLVYQPIEELLKHDRVYFVRERNSDDISDRRLAERYRSLEANEIFDLDEEVKNLLWK